MNIAINYKKKGNDESALKFSYKSLSEKDIGKNRVFMEELEKNIRRFNFNWIYEKILENININDDYQNNNQEETEKYFEILLELRKFSKEVIEIELIQSKEKNKTEKEEESDQEPFFEIPKETKHDENEQDTNMENSSDIDNEKIRDIINKSETVDSYKNNTNLIGKLVKVSNNESGSVIKGILIEYNPEKSVVLKDKKTGKEISRYWYDKMVIELLEKKKDSDENSSELKGIKYSKSKKNINIKTVNILALEFALVKEYNKVLKKIVIETDDFGFKKNSFVIIRILLNSKGKMSIKEVDYNNLHFSGVAQVYLFEKLINEQLSTIIVNTPFDRDLKPVNVIIKRTYNVGKFMNKIILRSN